MDIKIVNSEGKVEESKPVEMVEATNSLVITGELEVNAVASLFDLKPSEVGMFRDKISTLLDYAKSQTEDHSREGILWAIRSLQNKLGTPQLGEKLINYVSRYAWLKNDQARLNKEVERYEKNI